MPIKTVAVSRTKPSSNGTVEASSDASTAPNTKELFSPEEALYKLRTSLDHVTLRQCIEIIKPQAVDPKQFNIRRPGPLAAQLLKQLVSSTIPDFWRNLDDPSRYGKSKERKKPGSNVNRAISEEQRLILQCLCSVSGLGALCSEIRLYQSTAERPGKSNEAVNLSYNLSILLEVLKMLVHSDDFLHNIWSDLKALCSTTNQCLVQWKELMSIIASGKLLSIAAEAYDTVDKTGCEVSDISLIVDGRKYAAWVGRNLVSMAQELPQIAEEPWDALSQFLGRSLSLGHKGMDYQNLSAL